VREGAALEADAAAAAPAPARARSPEEDEPAALEAAAAAAAAALTLSPEQAALNRLNFVFGLCVYAGYWREIDRCVGACKDFANDTAKDGLLHLTMFYAAADADKADAAYTGRREFDPEWGGPVGPPRQHARLLRAARRGLTGRVAILVAAGARVNFCDKVGCTPLYWAAINNHASTVSALLDCPGVDVNAADADGRTPLFAASDYGNAPAVAVLLARRDVVDVAAASAWGQTPLAIARVFQYDDIVAMFVAAGVEA